MTRKQAHWATAWRKPEQKKQPGVLTLSEICILRRLRNGETQAEIARGVGLNRGTVSRHLLSARERFGVDTYDELLALPSVQEQLDGGTEAQP